MKKHIPNAITCCNLICGCVAAYFAFRGEYLIAYAAIVSGAVFDFFDGFAARLLHVSSPIGKELDSLADVITCGLAPSAILFSLLESCGVSVYVSALAFLVAAFSALRLAKFNLDERQTQGFLGLPTPANALFFASLASILPASSLVESHPMEVFYALLLLIPLSCWLLVSEVPMFALKFKSFRFSDNKLRYGFIIFSAIVLVILNIAAFVAIIPAYIITSLIARK